MKRVGSSIMQRITAAFLLVVLLCSNSPTLLAQSHNKLHSCARIDSILPPGSAVLKAHVQVSYNSKTDSTTLKAGKAAVVQTRMGGHGPVRAPFAQLTVMLNHVEADLVRRGQQPPTVTLTTDDSVSQELSPILFGSFVAIGGKPSPSIIQTPLSAELDAVNLIAIARAREAVLHVGPDVTIQISDDDRRDIAGLYVAMACGM